VETLPSASYILSDDHFLLPVTYFPKNLQVVYPFTLRVTGIIKNHFDLIIVADESMGHDAILGRDLMEICGLSINTLDAIKDNNFNNNTDNLNLNL